MARWKVRDKPYSAKFLRRVFSLPLRHTPKALLVQLCLYADHNGVCWPSLKTLARGLSVGNRATYNALRELEKTGYLERMSYSGPGKSTRRRINLKQVQEDAPVIEPVTGARDDEQVHVRAQTGAPTGSQKVSEKKHTEEPLSSPSARASSSKPSPEEIEEAKSAAGLVEVTDPAKVEAIRRELFADEAEK